MSTGVEPALKTSNHSPKLAPPAARSGSAMSSLMTIFADDTGVDALQVPNVDAFGPDQLPSLRSFCSDWPAVSVPASDTPMSTDVSPFAGPFFAVSGPS